MLGAVKLLERKWIYNGMQTLSRTTNAVAEGAGQGQKSRLVGGRNAAPSGKGPARVPLGY